MPKKGRSSAQKEEPGSSERLQNIILELNSHVQQLIQANKDLKTILDIAKIPVLFLGTDLRVKIFTQVPTELFDLRSDDIGRSIIEITRRFENPKFEDDLRHVIRARESVERDVAAAGERSYLMRALPCYQGGRNQRDCADLYRLHRAQEGGRAAKAVPGRDQPPGQKHAGHRAKHRRTNDAPVGVS